MARFLRLLGLMIIAAAVVMLMAGEAGAVPQHIVDQMLLPGLQAGAIALLAGLALSLLAPFGKMATMTRCCRCGTRIEKGQTYCHDHLRKAVQEFQDQTRGGC
jgi:hypothetical protein